MDINDFLSPGAVFELRETDKGRVLREMARRAAGILDIDSVTMTKAIVTREDLGSTGLGNGVALPHARIAGLPKPFGLFARLRPAVQFDAIDEHPVDLVFLLLLPVEYPDGHLKALACVARRLRDPVLAGKLRASRGNATLHALLTELSDSHIAANDPSHASAEEGGARQRLRHAQHDGVASEGGTPKA